MPKKASVPVSLDADQNLLLRANGGALHALHAQVVTLETGDTLVELGEAQPYVYFPTRGVISVLSSTRQGDTVEIAVIGREGAAALPATLGGGTSPVRLLVQVPGAAIRIDSRTLLGHFDKDPEFRQHVLRYLHVLMGQITQSAVCNRYHRGPSRLARWLLTVADRASTDVIPVTHEFAAIMIGDRRPRVTSALRGFKDRGLIRHRRAEITILDRAGLTRTACDCYMTVRSYFAEL